MLTELLKNGSVGNIELNAQKRMRESVTKRWTDLHFLDGLKGGLKENMAMLYENEAKHLIYEATDADNSGSFETVVFPIIRRVFSKLLANDIVSVQAMNLPVGKLFFILPVTSDREWENLDVTDPANPKIQEGSTASHKGLMGYDRIDRNKKGTLTPRYYLPDEVVNNIVNKYYLVPAGKKADGSYNQEFDTYQLGLDYITTGAGKDLGYTAQDIRKEGPEVVQYMEKSLYDLFYNDFLFDNSKGKITIKMGTAKPVIISNNGIESVTAATND